MTLLDRPAFAMLCVAGLAWLLFAPLRVSAAQPPNGGGQDKKAGSLIIGTVAADRGTTASIPIYYEPGKGTHLRSVHLELDFVSNTVKFAKAQKGIAGQGHNFDLAVQAKDQAPDARKIVHTRLTVDVSVPESSSGELLPRGPLAFLNFTVPSQAKPFAISLKPISVSARDASSKPVQIAAEAGKIIVSVPEAPLANCFFFTH